MHISNNTMLKSNLVKVVTDKNFLHNYFLREIRGISASEKERGRGPKQTEHRVKEARDLVVACADVTEEDMTKDKGGRKLNKQNTD